MPFGTGSAVWVVWGTRISQSRRSGGSIDIGEPRRTIYIEPIEEPVPAEAPEPSEPQPDPRKDLEREPA